MKTLLILLILTVPYGFTNAQKLTETYLRKAPPLPKDSCGITRVAMEQFTQSVRDLTDQLNEEISALNEKMDEQASENEEAIKENAMQQMTQQYGMSSEQINKMKSSDGMSEAEKDVLAGQIVMQQTSMSMEDIQKLSKMSDAEKNAYAAQMMATAQGKSETTFCQSGCNYVRVGEYSQRRHWISITASGQKIGNLICCHRK
ncbi:MAG: hypothetical protein U5K79_01725 [Cyclobacteriaceae bacterium]|nr:hypothetical protein [Cyclobacteriaceae bacterium]